MKSDDCTITQTRDIDTRGLKAEELRNIVLFLFPVVLQELWDHDRKKEFELWVYMVYLTRLAIFPGPPMAGSPKEQELQEQAHDHFYIEFEDHYGPENCIYSLHMFSHLPKVRERGLLSEVSCFQSEASYAPYRNNHHAGTTSPAKQAMESQLRNLMKEGHSCQRTLHIVESSKKPGAKTDNSLFYVQGFKFYKIIKGRFKGQKRIQCFQIKTRPFMPGFAELDMDKVGVFFFDTFIPGIVEVETKDILGKALLVKYGPGREMIVAAPTNVLNEGH